MMIPESVLQDLGFRSSLLARSIRANSEPSSAVAATIKSPSLLKGRSKLFLRNWKGISFKRDRSTSSSLISVSLEFMGESPLP